MNNNWGTWLRLFWKSWNQIDEIFRPLLFLKRQPGKRTCAFLQRTLPPPRQGMQHLHRRAHGWMCKNGSCAFSKTHRASCVPRAWSICHPHTCPGELDTDQFQASLGHFAFKLPPRICVHYLLFKITLMLFFFFFFVRNSEVGGIKRNG